METEIYKNLSLENLPNEEWRDVVGYEGSYMVSNLGRVKSLKRLDSKGRIIHEKIIKQNTNVGHGYCVANLYHQENGKPIKKQYTVHRLIAKAFIPNPENKPCIDHINTVRTDNRVENLKWVTYEENCVNPITKERTIKSFKEKAKDPKHREWLRKISVELSNTEEAKKKWRDKIYTPSAIERRHHQNTKAVLQIDSKGNVVNEFFSIAEAQRQTNIGHISSVCNGDRPKAGGYYWKFKE